MYTSKAFFFVRKTANYWRMVQKFPPLKQPLTNLNFLQIAENMGGKAVVKTSEALAAFAAAQFSSFDYVKPSPQELALEEIKALSGGPGSADPDLLEKNLRPQPQPLAKAGELARPPNAIRSASFLMQYVLLMQRILICAKRNYVSRNLHITN